MQKCKNSQEKFAKSAKMKKFDEICKHKNQIFCKTIAKIRFFAKKYKILNKIFQKRKPQEDRRTNLSRLFFELISFVYTWYDFQTNIF